MANPQDYQLGFTTSGLPFLEGKKGESVQALTPTQARKRLNELLLQQGDTPNTIRPAPRPRTRPQLPATPPPAPPVEPVQPTQAVPEALQKPIEAVQQQLPGRAIGSLPGLQGSPAASLLLQETGLTERKKPAAEPIPEAEMQRALQGVEDADELSEAGRRFEYYQRTKVPPEGWNPTPAETASLIREDLLTPQDLQGQGNRQIIWDALRAQQTSALQVPARLRALNVVQQEAVAPGERAVRQRLYKRGLSFSELGSSLDWYGNLAKLEDEYYTYLGQERIEEGKGPIEDASPEEKEEFKRTVAFRAAQTLQSIASASGLSISDVNNPEIQKNIEWWWAALEPYRAIFSPVTFFEPSPGGGLAVSPEEAVYNIGEPRYIPQAQEAYGSLQKFAMLASLFGTPIAARMESGEGWRDDQTIAAIREGRADPFDHLDKFGYLLTGDEDNRFNKVLGTSLLTVGLLLEPEPFTAILSVPAAGRKAIAYTMRKRNLTRPERILSREAAKRREGRITEQQFLENLREAGEPALADFLSTTGQQALGVMGSNRTAFAKFNRYIEGLEVKAADSQRKLVELSGESASASQRASLAQAQLQALEDAENLAMATMMRERALLDATLGLRGLTPEEAARVVDPKDITRSKYTADSRYRDITERRGKALEREANKAQKQYDAGLRSLNRENQQVGRVLQDILGTEVPAVGRTSTGRVSARWYPVVTTDSAGAIRVADSVPTVTGADIVAVWDDAAGKWVEPTGINPNRVYGGKREGPLQIENISAGPSNQRRRPAGSASLPETSNRKYDLWFDVVDSSGNRFRVRHPVSRSSWGRRPDARKLAGEGFGIDVKQAQALNNASRLRAEKLKEFAPVAAARDIAVSRRKAFMVAVDEAEKGTTATSRIRAWRNARNRYESASKARKEAAKKAGKAGKEASSAASRIRTQVIKFAEREADIASAQVQKEVLSSISDKVEQGLGDLQKILKERTGGILGATFRRGLNDIVDYQKLRPEEVREAVQNIVTKKIKDTKDGGGVIRSDGFKSGLEMQYMQAPNATRETAEQALELLKGRSPVAKKVLDAAEEGKSVALTAEEIADLQQATSEWVSKTWKMRQNSGPLSYGSALQRERDYYARLPAESLKQSVANWFRRKATKKVKDPVTAARALKMRQLGVNDEEIADVYIAASNLYDLGMDELLAVTNFGKMGPENATQNMIKLMDNEEKLVLRTTDSRLTPESLVSEETQQLDNLLGLDSRFIGARASLLDDLRVVPVRGVNDKTFYEKRAELAKSLGVSVDEVDPALVHRALDETVNDQSTRALETVAFAFYPPAINVEPGTGSKLTYAALEILRGKRAADGTFKGGAKTFREFSTRMIEATRRITGGADDSARAYAMASTGFTGAAVNGYAKTLAARVTYAPITPDQAVALNRLLVGNPQSKVDPSKRGYAAFALTEEQIDEGIEALAQLGIPLTERTIKDGWWKSGKVKAEVKETVKELVRVGSDPSANPYVIRGLLEQLDSFTQGATKKLTGFNPLKPEMNLPEAMFMKTQNSWDFLNSAWRTSLTTGILYPNPSYWANNIMGDFSQMWFETGLTTAARLSFNNFANNIPVWGRGLAERQAQMQAWAMKKGADALPNPLEVTVNPYLGKLLKGDDFVVVARDGTRIRGSDLMREAIEDGIYATQVNQELFTLFKKELEKNGWSKTWKESFGAAVKGDARITQLIADHANLVQQRQRMALYADFRMKGLSRIEARRRTLDALYDWKDGVSALEINTFVRLSPFYRFWRLGLRQMSGAFLEPVTKPITTQLLKSLKGQTKVARTKQQVLLFGGMPEIFGYGDMSNADSDASIMADFYAFKYPNYLDSKVIGTFSAMPSDKNWRDWYIRETGVNYDSIARVLPTATMLDLTSLLSSTLQGLYHVGTKITGKEPFGKAPPNWASQATEPWVQQLSPFIQDATRSVLNGAGVPTEYYSSNGQIKLSLGAQEVALGIDKVLGGIPLTNGLFGLPISDEPDPNSGKYTMNKVAYRMLELIGAPTGGLLTQAPRYIKAAKNPAWEDSWQEGVQWMLQSLFRVGAPTPYSGKKGLEMAMRKVDRAWSERETADVFKQFEDPRDPSLR